MTTSILDRVAAHIEAAPQSAQALLLYALLSTLAHEGSGCMFKLTKLRDMEPATRELAYALMELMAEGGNSGGDWDATLARVDTAIRHG